MKANSIGKSALKVITKQKAVVAIIFMMIVMIFPKTKFYTAYSMLEMLRSAAILEIVAFGVTCAVLAGGCDLSVGGTLCMGGILSIMCMNAGMPIWLSFVVALAVGAVIGFINGFLVVHQKCEPFIITLGMGMLLKGICQQITTAKPLGCKNMEFMKISNSKFFGSVPSLVVYMVILLAVFYCILRYTSYGRNLYAIGGNYEVAKYSGIKVVPTKWSTFVISGITATLAGVLLSSRMNTGNSVYGDTTGMMVNCGCVIGGTSFAGGEGGVIQSFIGLMVVQMLSTCMSALSVDGFWQKLIEGMLIVAIIAADCYSRKVKRERV